MSTVGVLDSDLYASLPAGEWIIYSGVYAERGDAEKAVSDVRADYPGASAVEVSTKQPGSESAEARAESGRNRGAAGSDRSATATGRQRSGAEQRGWLRPWPSRTACAHRSRPGRALRRAAMRRRPRASRKQRLRRRSRRRRHRRPRPLPRQPAAISIARRSVSASLPSSTRSSSTSGGSSMRWRSATTSASMSSVSARRSCRRWMQSLPGPRAGRCRPRWRVAARAARRRLSPGPRFALDAAER